MRVCSLLMCSSITLGGMVATYLNGLWSNSNRIRCVSCSPCAYVWEVAACWNMLVMCRNTLSEYMCKLCSTVSQFGYSASMCKVGKSAADMMHGRQTVVYGDNTLNKTAVCHWYNRFKSGQELLEDEPGSG